MSNMHRIISVEGITGIDSPLSHRRQAGEDNTSLLKAALESIQEGIIGLQKDQTILIYNSKFLTLWGLSEALLAEGNASRCLAAMAAQVKDEADFMTTLQHVLLNPNEVTSKIIELKAGPVFEMYAHQPYLENKALGVLLSFRDVTEQKRLEQQLIYQTTHDLLTGLPNRALLTDRIQQSIAHAKRYTRNIGILMIDLDHFKEINDLEGHSEGDNLLKQVAKRLSSSLREVDTVTRFGGDEFAVVMSEIKDANDLIVRAQKLLALFTTPFEVGSQPKKISVSIGISIYPQNGNQADELLKNADAALYHAKEEGRGSMKLYTTDYNASLLKQAELRDGLKWALERDEFILHYQPLIQLSPLKIIGVEALLRWNNPALGLIQPNDFIAIAEKSGLIIPIGEWVLKTACKQASKWSKSFFKNMSMAVNISAYQFMEQSFVPMVMRVLKQTQFPPQFLELEITESVILEHSAVVLQKMYALKKLGIQISMDDFGTGYASFNYIKHYPFDKIKIDQSFIHGINSNIDDNNIIEAIIQMTKSMELSVLAEGVETKDQLDFLRKQHGTQIQGYYFSPPLSVKDCEEFITKNKTGFDF